MNGLRGEQTDPGVMMFRVIPGEEALGEAAAVLDATKAERRKSIALGLILSGLGNQDGT